MQFLPSYFSSKGFFLVLFITIYGFSIFAVYIAQQSLTNSGISSRSTAVLEEQAQVFRQVLERSKKFENSQTFEREKSFENQGVIGKPKEEQKVEQKIEQKEEPKVEQKVEPKIEQKVEPKVENKQPIVAEKPKQILPEKTIKKPTIVYYQIQKDGKCLALSNSFSEHRCPLLEITTCETEKSQIWQFNGELLSANGNCLDAFIYTPQTHACSCHGNFNQRWKLEDSMIIGLDNKCLGYFDSKVATKGCDDSDPQQKWKLIEVDYTPPKAQSYASILPIYPGLSPDSIGFEDKKAMEKVKGMMLHAWNGYEKYAWGHDELKPVSKTGRNWMGAGLAATIVDSLDTLWIMGLRDEYKKARDYVEEKLNFDKPSLASFFEITIRHLGGLLSAYGLTHDKMFIEKAEDLGKRLLYAFNSPSGLPYSLIDLQSHAASNQRWNPGNHILAEIGTIQLEFKYLSEITGDPIYADKANKVHEIMKGQDSRDPGLYPVFINEASGSSKGTQDYTFGGLGDSYYEYLLKQWLQTNQTETRFKYWYDRSIISAKKLMIGTTVDGQGKKHTYIGKYKNGWKEPAMEHLACFTGGMFALGAHTKVSSDPDFDIILGDELTETCRDSYLDQPSLLGPEKFGFGSKITAQTSFYILRPEYVESLFYMWRITKDEKYRAWGWDVINTLELVCRTEAGYSGIQDVTSSNPPKNDVQESFFLAETLKYLYLLYTDDDVIPLDQYVFNTEAHPLPVFTPTVFDFKEFDQNP